MSALSVEQAIHGSYQCGPALELAYSEGSVSRKLHEGYVDLRSQAALEPKPAGQELENIQADVSAWLEQEKILELPADQESRIKYYSTFDEAVVRGKVIALVDYLRRNHGHQISSIELDATEKFVEAAFAMYSDEPSADTNVMDDADGSFAFVVPARMSRNDSEYGEEVEPVIPALRYVPKELRAQMMVGLPPFVIDTYKPDENGRHGVLVLAPVFGDMAEDIESTSAKMGIAQANVNAAVNFAHRRYGVEVVGLGATLPSLTLYGKKITNKNVITTTGHGGTAQLIAQTMEAGLQARGVELQSIGVLGMGAIGASVAEVIADRYSEIPVSIYDTSASKAAKVAERNPGRFSVAESDSKLVAENQVVISAITSRFDTAGIAELNGTIVIDDAQPASFDPQAVEALGGTVQWVIGRDAQGIATRTGYDYATMLDPHTDVFGCEAEAASIAAYMNDLRGRGMDEKLVHRIAEKVAIRSAVDASKVRIISALFKKFGIIASEPQAFGRPVVFE